MAFFSRRPILTQNLTNAPLMGAQNSAIRNRMHLSNLAFLERGLGQFSAGMFGSPEFHREQRRNERQDELIQQSQEREDEAFDLKTALDMKVPVEVAGKFRRGEIGPMELLEAAGPARKYIEEQESIKAAEDFRTGVQRLREKRTAEMMAEAGGLLSLRMALGDNPVAAYQGVRESMLKMPGADDGIDIEQLTKTYGSQALDVLPLLEQVRTGGLTPELTEAFRNIKTQSERSLGIREEAMASNRKSIESLIKSREASAEIAERRAQADEEDALKDRELEEARLEWQKEEARIKRGAADAEAEAKQLAEVAKKREAAAKELRSHYRSRASKVRSEIAARRKALIVLETDVARESSMIGANPFAERTVKLMEQRVEEVKAEIRQMELKAEELEQKATAGLDSASAGNQTAPSGAEPPAAGNQTASTPAEPEQKERTAKDVLDRLEGAFPPAGGR